VLYLLVPQSNQKLVHVSLCPPNWTIWN